MHLSMRQESIFQQLTPIAVAEILEIPEPYRSHVPHYLKEPNTKIPKREVKIATKRFRDYQRLSKNSKGIANY